MWTTFVIKKISKENNLCTIWSPCWSHRFLFCHGKKRHLASTVLAEVDAPPNEKINIFLYKKMYLKFFFQIIQSPGQKIWSQYFVRS
jgi:hypothetical protein